MREDVITTSCEGGVITGRQLDDLVGGSMMIAVHAYIYTPGIF